MLDHISLRVSDIARSTKFYTQALAPLGYKPLMEFPTAVGYGVDRKPDFWITQVAAPINPTHIAFAASSRKEVHAFHEAALAAGGKDNGGPGPRTEYHPHYYGSFIYDPDQHNIEAVIHKPE
jgi:catechol 2,3-dioxygenase-like lactoylglutathione lyase family enzyme